MAIKEEQYPKAIESEKVILGTMISEDGSSYNSESEVLNLRDNDFYLEKHKKIFNAICRLSDGNRKICLATVLHELKLCKVDIDEDYLFDLELKSTTKEKLLENIRILKDVSNLRYLLITIKNIESNFLNKNNKFNDYSSFVAEAQKEIDDITAQRKILSFVSSKEIVKKIDNIIFENKTDDSPLDTGFKELNKCGIGTQDQNLIIIAGRTGLGKTTLALNLLLNIAMKNNKSVALFEMEMSCLRLYYRLISILSRVEYEKIAKSYLKDIEKLSVKDALNKLADLKIYVDESSSLTMLDLVAKARKLKTEQPDLSLIVVDYLGLIMSDKQKDRYQSRQLEIQEYTRILHNLALELKIPIVVLCQLNRRVDDRSGNVPRLSDLRESGSIEQDAELVLLLHRDDYGKNELSNEENQKEDKKEEERNYSKDYSIMNIIVAKNRNGRSDYVFSLLFDKRFSILQDMEDENKKNYYIKHDN